MLKRHSQLFLKLFIINDLIINSLSWLLAYYLRFVYPVIPVTKGMQNLHPYLPFLIYINVIWLLIYRENKLYEPKRGSARLEEFSQLAKSITLGVVIITGMMFFYRDFMYSRLVVLYFWVINIVLAQISRTMTRSYLYWLRSRGYNLRYLLIIGAGDLGTQLKEKIEACPGLGYKVVGFLDDDPCKIGRNFAGVRVLGGSDILAGVLAQNNIDEVFIALPMAAHQRMVEIISLCQKSGVRVKIVPNIYDVMAHQASIDELDGIPLIGFSQSALEHMANRFVKRIEDVAVSCLLLLLFSPLLLIIGVLIKLTSRGPVFYKQERTGMDNRPFWMYKFRSMRQDAEQKSGPVWAVENDSRRTGLGGILRSTSLDELPQLLNVLKGDMSLVGPRPERPYFVNQFKEEIACYMRRHHVKAGITGWAQVNGWRGNTSIEKRVEHDIYYIENWTLSLDLKILWMTIWKGFVNESAY